MKKLSVFFGKIRFKARAYFQFNPLMYLWSSSKLQDNYTQLKRLSRSIEGKNVYLLGSGPSLDKVDLNELSDSVVVFLNYSYLNYLMVSSSNKLFWMCIHTTIIPKVQSQIPRHITKIIIPNSYWNFQGIKRASAGDSIYLHPKPSYDSFRIFPKPSIIKLDTDDTKIVEPSGINLYPSNVMLNAIFLFLYCGANKITCLGFDAPIYNANSKPYAYAKSLPNNNLSLGFNIDEVELFLSKLLKYANSMGSSIVNCSPGSNITVLPSSSHLP